MQAAALENWSPSLLFPREAQPIIRADLREKPRRPLNSEVRRHDPPIPPSIMKSTLHWVILSAAVLCGCKSPPAVPSASELWQRESSQIGASFREDVNSARSLDVIRSKIALLSPRDITFAMLADTTKPSEPERNAILEFARIRETFIQQQQLLDERYQYPYRRISMRQQQAVSAVWADLYNGQMTYGESAKRRQEIDATANEARDRMRSAMASEAAAAEQASLLRLNNYLILQQTLQQQLAAQASLPASPQTIRLQTTCNKIGTMLFCK
jgi:hypothetical protein